MPHAAGGKDVLSLLDCTKIERPEATGKEKTLSDEKNKITHSYANFKPKKYIDEKKI